MERTQRIPGAKSVHHVSIRAVDWDGSLRLYRDLLGMEPVADASFPDGKRLVRLSDREGREIELVSADADRETATPAAGAIAHIAFAVSDVAEAVAVVEAQGLTVTMPPTEMDITGLRATIAFFLGPNGESIELFREADRTSGG